MDAFEFRQLITKSEWTDIELKKSANAFPQDAASTICAFANSGGGYLVLGIDEKQLPAISGIYLDKVDEVQNQCFGLLKDKSKFSCLIEYDPPSLIDIDGCTVIVVFIQDAKRQNKPVKVLENKHWTTYLRKAARDEKASDEEVRRMVIDSNNSSITDQLVNLDVEACFSEKTIKWYRKVYESRHNQKHYELSHVEFLDELGLIRDDGGELKPTKAAVLMFGREKNMTHMLSRKVVDAIWYRYSQHDVNSAERWADRRPLEDQTPNLFDAWQVISERFMYWSETPFAVDENNLQRSHETPDYIGFREAMVNLLIHQDFSDHSRVPQIQFFKDVTIYWNPGDSLVDDSLLSKGQSASRNPLIMQTFHRIGLSDRAGSGLKEIYKSWQQLDRPIPEINNDKVTKSFKITLGQKLMFSALQELLQQRIGAKLSALQAQVFVLCLSTVHTVETLATTLRLATVDIYPVLDSLSRQGLIVVSQAGYQAAEHFCASLSDLVQKSDQPKMGLTKLNEASDQPQGKVTNLIDQPKIELSHKQRQLIDVLEGEMSLKQLMVALGVSHRSHFKNNQLQPLIDNGLVAQTHPENINHQDQAYFLSEHGRVIKQ